MVKKGEIVSLMEQKAEAWKERPKKEWKVPQGLSRDEKLLLIGELRKEIAWLSEEIGEIKTVLEPLKKERMKLLRKKWALEESITHVQVIDLKAHREQLRIEKEIEELRRQIKEAEERGITLE